MRKEYKIKLSVLAISFFLLFNFIFLPKARAVASPETFIENIYRYVLKRPSDSKGLDYWLNKLSNDEITGADLIQSFLNSPEYNGNMSNIQYITMLYNALLGRTPDKSGQSWYLKLMDNGYSRLGILHQMVNSDEFKSICSHYDIRPGEIKLAKTIDARPDLVMFVTNFYKKALNRNPDAKGLDFYVNELASGKIDGANLAKEFLFSSEFKKLNYNDSVFIKKLYNSLFNRDADGSDLTYWTSLLAQKYSRYNIFSKFVNSNEYTKICNKYNIKRGSIILSDLVDTRPDLNRFIFNIYKSALNREPDKEGLEYYVSNLATRKISGASVAESLIKSVEFNSKRIADDDYIKVLYNAFFQRVPDTTGLKWWNNMLLNGYSRHYALAGFINSREFGDLCKQYNIIQGHINITIADTSTYYNVTLQDVINKQYDYYKNLYTLSDISYYLNPSNFLNNEGRYQFLRLNSTYNTTADVLNNLLENKGILQKQGETFLSASTEPIEGNTNPYVNPLYLIAHSLLETGNGTSALANGVPISQLHTYDSNGLTSNTVVPAKITYNMFGFGAYSRGVGDSATTAGAEYAYKMGWFTPEEAIMGGAKMISQNYINNSNRNQNTLYKMKWNPGAFILTPSNPITHQYASDEGWAYKISKIISQLVNMTRGNLPDFDVPQYKK